MFTRFLTLCSSFLLLAFSLASQAEDQGGQFKNLGDWEVHYIAFPSTFLQPNIAKSYGLERSKFTGVVNISVLDSRTKDKVAQRVTIKGKARNLLGNTIDLEFKEVVEGDAVYYLAPIKFYNEEVYRFEIDLQQDRQIQQLTFQQKFYVD
ncbi:DUF4426 domain-containing protein [Pseudoalteromonas tunicata]|uniref:DUF4426 domain-containing protein n=1 Tax=Pseudoalteromonas tunicata D2 TaxID=87626 RepID=A4C930_9GAMM|nr:DUF4426 domain-containing protein [Pseudoalteromonas tunicata]ATC93597.1 hypothetical protein PTUN_a0884 [Pseudoalteromonas tunicata]AXT29435.1 DUF4426 domain-containing protein [Pseudoalteromonas tunicata]EAR29095.1 hypothetical protein PTD2_08624 [Pseudoalteromonas tunicata D2]MDP5211812.1 DUF4426 domain-containing protein [Pseudoalteromonas tunicata]